MELWTNVRFFLYPLMIVGGLTWTLLTLRQYRQRCCSKDMWATRLGFAIAVQGAAGFVALLISVTQGFGPLSSAVFTVGPLTVTLVTITGAVTMLVAAWRSGKRDHS